jgi:hypothetical protein
MILGRKIFCSVGVCLFTAGFVSARPLATALSFTGLNNVNGAENTLRVNGSADGLIVSRAVSGNDYLFSITYSGADYNGDIVNDTLTFDLRVSGFSGGVIVSGLDVDDAGGIKYTGSATIGTTSQAVTEKTGGTIVGAGFSVGDSNMDPGESLKFSVENIVIKDGDGTVIGTGECTGFNAVRVNEGSGNSHVAVVGVGDSGLAVSKFDLSRNFTLNNLIPLYVSSAAPPGSANQPYNWGVETIAFSLKVTADLLPMDMPTVEWIGAVDSNWNTAGNWQSGLVPGTETNELAVLSGIGDAPVVATPGESTNFYSVAIYDEASLKICNDMKHFAYMQLGSVYGAGGGHVTQMKGVSPIVAVAYDLWVGGDSGAASASTYTVASGSLTVANQLYIDQGTFAVDGPAASINAGSMTITTNGGLHFDFDWAGVSPIVVSDAFTVASGAKLTIDLRGYTSGGNVIELVKFGSMSGSFDPEDITIIGLGGGTISYDAGSLNLTVFDAQEAQANTLWFIATGGTGTDPQDLRVNTGRRIRDLSSPYLSYSQASDGNDLVYSVSWSGSDFDGDGFNDVISFDLRVEGFSGSTYAYSTNAGASSMTALGTSAIVQSGFSAWGVGSGARMVAGDSLRLSVENLHSSAGHSHPLKGFVAFRFEEPYAGHSHRIIIGQGAGLDTVQSNSPESVAIPSVTNLVVTSAGSAGQGWALGHAVIQFTVSALPDTMVPNNVSDYSTLPTGPSYRTEYAAQTSFTNFPAFSWDIVPRWGQTRGLITSQNASLARNHQVLTMSQHVNYGTASIEDGQPIVAALLKSFNPDLKITTYRNTLIHFPGYAANALYKTNEWAQYHLDTNGERVYDMIRIYHSHNLSYPEMRQWWVDLSVSLVSQPEIDGIFVDKAGDQGCSWLDKDGQGVPSTDRLQMYHDLLQQLPAGKFVVGNTLRNERPGGSRELMHLFQGSYVERWEHHPDGGSPVAQSEADVRCASIQQMREAAVKGKILMPALQDRPFSHEYIDDQIAAGYDAELIQEINAGVALPLAYYLIVAEPYSYFRYQPDASVNRPEYIYDPTDYVDELTRPLGAPLGPPVKDGYVYTRSFEHVDVWLNVETNEAVLTWKDGASRLIGQDHFDAIPVCLTRTFSATANSSSATWDIVNRSTVKHPDILDTSLYLQDGSVGDGSDTTGYLKSTKNDRFLGIANGSGKTLTYTFDITGYTDLKLMMDWIASGDYLSTVEVTASIDGEAPTEVFSVRSSPSAPVYTMEDGRVVLDFNNSAQGYVNGVAGAVIEDRFVTFSPVISGSGSTLTLVIQQTGSYSGALGMDRLKLYGTLLNYAYEIWASGHGLSGENALPTANPDGDAYNNWQEYIAGLNPNVFDTFAITNFAAGESNTLEWSAASDRVYNVYWSSNLLNGFELLGSNVPGGVFTVTNHAEKSQGFYKISVGLE